MKEQEKLRWVFGSQMVAALEAVGGVAGGRRRTGVGGLGAKFCLRVCVQMPRAGSLCGNVFGCTIKIGTLFSHVTHQ